LELVRKKSLLVFEEKMEGYMQKYFGTHKEKSG